MNKNFKGAKIANYSKYTNHNTKKMNVFRLACPIFYKMIQKTHASDHF